MSLFQSLLQAVRSWRRRRGGPKNPKRAGVALERLDHRQLLTVNFTGNVFTDFPVGQQGIVRVVPTDGQQIEHPLIPPDLQPYIPVSGFDIQALRVAYDPINDQLDIGIEQPDRAPSDPNDNLPVLAGDADDNGNSATVSPAVNAVDPFFNDYPDLGGSETLGAFINLNPGVDDNADLVAGFQNDDPVLQKTYQVADAVVNPSIRIPAFGAPRPQNTGTFFLFNNPLTPAFEFSISHFSQVFQEKTGQPLTADSVITIGAFGGSVEGGISEAFMPATPVSIASITPPPICPPQQPCPPASPVIKINPHENNHVNTAHPERVRAYVYGSSGFDVNKIDISTVRLGGATPYFSRNQDFNHDGFADRAFFFKGNDISLPSGPTVATLTGDLTDGTKFESSVFVFNRDASYYSPAALAGAEQRQAARAAKADQIVTRRQQAMLGEAVAPQMNGPAISIPRRANARPQSVKIAGVGHARTRTTGQPASNVAVDYGSPY